MHALLSTLSIFGGANLMTAAVIHQAADLAANHEAPLLMTVVWNGI